MLKFIVSFFKITALIVVIVIAGFYFLLPDMCGNEVHKVYESPDSELKAVIFERSCGATTGFSTQISILKKSVELENDSGNIFILSGHPDNVSPKLKWIGKKELHVYRSLNGSESIALK